MRSVAVAEHAASRVAEIADRCPAVNLHVAVRLQSPGDPCVNLSNDLAFAYDPPLPEARERELDTALFDAIYDAVDFGVRPLPPEGLKVSVTALTSDPPLATILTDDPTAYPILAEQLAALLHDTIRHAYQQLPQ